MTQQEPSDLVDTTSALLCVSGLKLSFPSKGELFTGLNFELKAGQAVLLQGRSGAGKSTLLRCMAGLEAQARSTLYWQGREVKAKEMPAFRLQASYVAQSSARLPMSVEESLQAAFLFRNQPACYEPEKALRMLEQLHLPKQILSQRLADLSGGEAQRVGFIRALLLQPRVLLLDEPASSLDPEARSSLATVLKQWWQDGQRSLVICSHQPQWCEDLLTHQWDLNSQGLLESRSA